MKPKSLYFKALLSVFAVLLLGGTVSLNWERITSFIQPKEAEAVVFDFQAYANLIFHLSGIKNSFNETCKDLGDGVDKNGQRILTCDVEPDTTYGPITGTIDYGPGFTGGLPAMGMGAPGLGYIPEDYPIGCVATGGIGGGNSGVPTSFGMGYRICERNFDNSAPNTGTAQYTFYISPSAPRGERYLMSLHSNGGSNTLETNFYLRIRPNHCRAISVTDEYAGENKWRIAWQLENATNARIGNSGDYSTTVGPVSSVEGNVLVGPGLYTLNADSIMADKGGQACSYLIAVGDGSPPGFLPNLHARVAMLDSNGAVIQQTDGKLAVADRTGLSGETVTDITLPAGVTEYYPKYESDNTGQNNINFVRCDGKTELEIGVRQAASGTYCLTTSRYTAAYDPQNANWFAKAKHWLETKVAMAASTDSVTAKVNVIVKSYACNTTTYTCDEAASGLSFSDCSTACVPPPAGCAGGTISASPNPLPQCTANNVTVTVTSACNYYVRAVKLDGSSNNLTGTNEPATATPKGYTTAGNWVDTGTRFELRKAGTGELIKDTVVACTTPPPVETTKNYGCNPSTNSCEEQVSGPYTSSDCSGACTALKLYACNAVTGACEENAGGSYASNTCNGSCVPPEKPPRYSCNAATKTCSADADFGYYSDSATCSANCGTTYNCSSSGACVEATGGSPGVFSDSSCLNMCSPPPPATNYPNLRVGGFHLTDANGFSQTYFNPGEPIYFNATFESTAKHPPDPHFNATYTSGGVTVTGGKDVNYTFYGNWTGGNIPVGTPSDVGINAIYNGVIQKKWEEPGDDNLTGAGGPWVYRSPNSFSISNVGTYNAAVYGDSKDDVKEFTELDNQWTSYTYNIVPEDNPSCDGAWHLLGAGHTAGQPVGIYAPANIITGAVRYYTYNYADSIPVVMRGLDNKLYARPCRFKNKDECTWDPVWTQLNTGYSSANIVGSPYSRMRQRDYGWGYVINSWWTAFQRSDGNIYDTEGAYTWPYTDSESPKWGRPYRFLDKTGRTWQVRRNSDNSISYSCGANLCVDTQIDMTQSKVVTPKVGVGGTVEIACSYRVQTDAIKLPVFTGADCTSAGMGFQNWGGDGTAAIFHCRATSAGVHEVSCGGTNNYASFDSNICEQGPEEIGTVTVGAFLAPANDNVCVSLDVPSTVKPGEAFQATVTVKNTGSATWENNVENPANPYRIAAVNSSVGKWGVDKAELNMVPIANGNNIKIDIQNSMYYPKFSAIEVYTAGGRFPLNPYSCDAYNATADCIYAFDNALPFSDSNLFTFWMSTAPSHSGCLLYGNSVNEEGEVMENVCLQPHNFYKGYISMPFGSAIDITKIRHYSADVIEGDVTVTIGSGIIQEYKKIDGGVWHNISYGSPNRVQTFTVNAVAPNQVGSHDFEWQMLKDGIGAGTGLFGPVCKATVNVADVPVCPAASVSLASNTVSAGGSTTASAPAGWSGGVFNSANTAVATVSGVTINGVSGGTAAISGSGWIAPNGATSCSLSPQNVTVSSGPPPPSLFTGSNSGVCQQVNLTWTDVSGETGYYIYRNQTGNVPDPSSSTDRIASLGTNVTSYENKNLPVGNYYYWVVSHNSGGPSAPKALAGGSIYSNACDANLDESVKNISAYNLTNFDTGGNCNGARAVPANTTFKVGDNVTFKIDVCNTSSVSNSDADNVILSDSLSYLEAPSSVKIDGAAIASMDSCTTTPSLNKYSVCGDAATKKESIYINVGTVAGGVSKIITFTSKISVPASFVGNYGRFQNKVRIDYAKNDSGTTGFLNRETPLYPFTLGNQYPSYQEVAP